MGFFCVKNDISVRIYHQNLQEIWKTFLIWKEWFFADFIGKKRG